MTSHLDAGARSRHSVRAAVLAAALAIAGCFTAAFTFADQPTQVVARAD